ncbi:ubiquitin carboxyl-terminal hydrolase 8-like isoform X2 [Amborella trichopoda]|nr:ubiquitin carboxyl-terminal hydrolase 8-like isoform X2 [Amborella trichopoda]XP_020524731.1 ubiquitin carboxyl-terminal hydrolase 8-like isoform X2 [Amborella trichopoda]|eukprot:XP_020524730.1 ubiquitin carboxyl-terminal hydrolase 8-like isoform X2 [Amborella trichopoda]
MDGNVGILYNASLHPNEGASKYFNYFNSDILFYLKREDNTLFSEPNGEFFLDKDCVLLSENMWLKLLKWHKASKVTARNAGFRSMADDATFDVYPLQLRLSAIREANLMTAKISKKDNAVYYKAASTIFNLADEPVCFFFLNSISSLFLVCFRLCRWLYAYVLVLEHMRI